MYSFSIGVFLKCDVSLHSGKEKEPRHRPDSCPTGVRSFVVARYI